MTGRVGTGFDAHPLTEGRALVLGGIEVPFHKGLAGHSDGDVVVHAIIDALLGAAGLGDIGTHFPPDDPSYKDASSLGLLSQVAKLIYGEGNLREGAGPARWRVENLDATMLAQKPMLAPYIQSMKEKIATTLNITVSQVSLKATTTDHLGFVGREEGIAAHAVVLLEAAE